MDIAKTRIAAFNKALLNFNGSNVEDVFVAYEEALPFKRWMDEALRQVVVSEVKKELAKQKVFDAKTVAITICPAEPTTPDLLQSMMEVVKSVTAIKSMHYVFEQRSKPGETPHGWHVHIAADTSYAPSKIKQFITQKLKSRNYVYTIHVTPANANWKDKYMSGLKANADKDAKVQHDIILRKQLGIPDIIFYSKDNAAQTNSSVSP